MQQILSSINPDDGPSFVTAYMDDISVFSSTLTEHLYHLRSILEKLRDAGLKLNPSKSHFIHKVVEYLGHVITPCELQPNGKLIDAVKQFVPPRNVQELRRFLDRLTRKGTQFVWSSKCEAAFQQLKHHLVTAPVLAYPSFDKDFVLETDASAMGTSAMGLEAVLAQY